MLTVSVYKTYFDLIINRWKLKEYRKKTAYYKSRLFNKDGSLKHDTIKIINGYGHKRPYIVLELIDVIEYKQVYCIQLGNIIELGNLENYFEDE